MSKMRMLDLMSALNDEGWRLLGHGQHPRASADPFGLERDSVTWVIVRGEHSAAVELEFDAFADLGQRTGRLSDIMYCDVVGCGMRLHFVDRDSPTWGESVRSFARALRALSER
jgi:hypothetical protein